MELLPREQVAFQHMLDDIRETFEAYGFLPVETPVFELTNVLLTKTGGETERQVYFVQSTGGMENRFQGLLEKFPLDSEGAIRFPPSSLQAMKALPDLALRFDLTVPLARYVAEHEHELAFPFRRYQMQRVYRGERSQRGRFREFYQCDIDVIGKDTLSLRFDAEIPAVINAAFEKLAIGEFTIHLNHRKLLRGFFEGQGISGDKQLLVLRELDKLDKRGEDAVIETLVNEDFALDRSVVEKLMAFSRVRSKGYFDACAKLMQLGSGTSLFEEGREELLQVLSLLKTLGVPESRYAINLSIARGLDYYTGVIYETVLDAHPNIGSICSGGRYDNLAGHYTKSKLPGVGISIGLTRLFYQLQEAGLIRYQPSDIDALIALIEDENLPCCLKLAAGLRRKRFKIETQFEAKKLAKQIQYATKKGIRFLIIYGSEEQRSGVVAVKDLELGHQVTTEIKNLAFTLRAAKKNPLGWPAIKTIGELKWRYDIGKIDYEECI
jgi:histidyl-tRNA synthetase